ncbi:hypothetical protein D0Z03_000006 [Geotrichum reessii]|nr:hypothetical protein D0Z03_000006 [Galactomyces reessii]
MAKDSKAKVKKVKNSKDSKPKSNNSGISKSEPFAPEAHPFIKKLAANDHKVSNGIRFHIFDIYLDELERIVKEGEEINDEEEIDWKSLLEDVPVKELLAPIEEMSKESKFKLVRENAAEVLKDSRLITWGVVEAPSLTNEESDDEDEWGGFE